MINYSITSVKWEGEIKLSYYPNGLLAKAELPDTLRVADAEYLATHFPVTDNLIDWYRKNSNAIIRLIENDTSFDAFWAKYNQKRGSKEVARMYWEGSKKTINKRPITSTDRHDIINILDIYLKRFPPSKKEFQPLATSFLHERYWEAESENMVRCLSNGEMLFKKL